VSTRPCTRHLAPIHPRSVAAVEHFPCQALEGRVSDISRREGYSWHLNSTQHREFKHETGNRSCSKVRPQIAPRPYRPTGYIRPPTLMTPIPPRQSRLSIGASGRDESQLFRCKRPINRALGFCHGLRFNRSLAPCGNVCVERDRPFPHLPSDTLNDRIFDAAIFHVVKNRNAVFGSQLATGYANLSAPASVNVKYAPDGCMVSQPCATAALTASLYSS